MKQLQLNMNEAFKLRNKIKAKLTALQNMVRRATLFVDPEMTEEDALRSLDGETFDSVVAKTERLMDALCSLNTVIDQHNVENRSSLNELETIKVKESLNRTILDAIRSSTVFERQVNTVTGETKKVRLRPIFADKNVFVQKEKEFARKKQEVEEKISAANGATSFTFAIDEAVYDSIFA